RYGDRRFAPGVRTAVFRLFLYGLASTGNARGALSLAYARPFHDADYISYSLWRWRACAGTPLGKQGSALRAYSGVENGGAVGAAQRPRVIVECHPRPGSGGLLRAQGRVSGVSRRSAG